ncbi:putative DMT superfamily transporter inner membrane protein [mine drainage metagenome]|uniref:Putative DMT superfamily transporter inner membrane protein n=1 Tax=mine drainage metagenome TaxID=410659 RepID=A0A1J5Q1A4_9ZZZZ
MTKSSHRTGLLLGIGAYFCWGLFPLYWPLLEPALPLEILAHRVTWSLLVCIGALAFRHQLVAVWHMLKDRRVFGWLALASVCLSLNWGIFIWAINSGHVVESALGYYINPLVMIAAGVLLLGEKMRRAQWIAVAFGTVSVIVLSVDYGHPPYIALSLAFSWGFYGLIKKHLSLGALETLTIETLLMIVPAVGYILFLANRGTGQLGSSPHMTILLMTAGVVTAVPLLLFNGATSRIPLSTIGLLQYLNPTMQFVIGILIRHEKMSQGRWMGFILIWVALVLLSVDGFRSRRTIDDSIAESH